MAFVEARTVMTAGEGHSITGWLGELKEGDQAAAQPLWEQYFSKLVTVARAKLRRMRRSAADEDEEDAAFSAFNSFCDGAARGKFPQLADRDDLWRLLVVITARKAMAQANRDGRQKRGGGRVVEEAVLFGRDGRRPRRDSMAGLERIAAAGPTPEFAAMMAEECRSLLDALDDDSLRQVALSPDGGLQQRRDRRPARLRRAHRGPAAGADPQDMARQRRRWPDGRRTPSRPGSIHDLEQARRIHLLCEDFEAQFGDEATCTADRRVCGAPRGLDRACAL